MIERQFFRSKFMVTILTTVSVSRKDIDARELDGAMAVLQSHQFQQPHDRGKFDRERNSMNLTIVDLQHFDFPLPEERDRFLPMYNP